MLESSRVGRGQWFPHWGTWTRDRIHTGYFPEFVNLLGFHWCGVDEKRLKKNHWWHQCDHTLCVICFLIEILPMMPLISNLFVFVTGCLPFGVSLFAHCHQHRIEKSNKSNYSFNDTYSLISVEHTSLVYITVKEPKEDNHLTLKSTSSTRLG